MKPNRIPQVALFIDNPSQCMDALSKSLAHQILCLGEKKTPCGCFACYLIEKNSHPDAYFITPKAHGSQITIEQSRELEHLQYKAPQIGNNKVFFIYPAERMNKSCASSLLKTLEEPSDSSIFVLITHNIDLLLPTIISRCEKISLINKNQSGYPPHKSMAFFCENNEELQKELGRLISGEISVCTLSERWAKHNSLDVLRGFSIQIYNLIKFKLLAYNPNSMPDWYSKEWDVVNLYPLLDQIYDKISALQQNINLNIALVWERLLLQFIQCRVIF